MPNNFSESVNRLHNIEEELQDFLEHFESVFQNDWYVSKGCLQDADNIYISENGTFLNPQVDDESNNWANRGALLASYRRLKTALEGGANNE